MIGHKLFATSLEVEMEPEGLTFLQTPAQKATVESQYCPK